jgi:hypothetical protein
MERSRHHPVRDAYPIEMMKNTKDLPVQDEFDFI